MNPILSLLNTILNLFGNTQSSDAPDADSPAGPITPKQDPSSTLPKIEQFIADGAFLETTGNGTVLLKVERLSQSDDGVFGRLFVNGRMVCETVENLGKEIPEGLYDAVIDKSPRLDYNCPHIRVPLRDKAANGDAGIRIHKANEPCQLEGCIATGTKKDGDAEDESGKAFDKLMALLPAPGVPFKVLIYSVH